MAETGVTDENNPPATRPARAPLLLAAVAALSLGCAGYLAVGQGFLPGLTGASASGSAAEVASAAGPETMFLALEPFMVTLPRTDPVRQLRLELQLELPKSAEAAVRAATPRLQATMNTYLMAVDLSDIEDPNEMLRVRMQLLRRLQVAVGEGFIHDLLITQFLIS